MKVFEVEMFCKIIPENSYDAGSVRVWSSQSNLLSFIIVLSKCEHHLITLASKSFIPKVFVLCHVSKFVYFCPSKNYFGNLT